MKRMVKIIEVFHMKIPLTVVACMVGVVTAPHTGKAEQITIPNPSFEKECSVRGNEPEGWMGQPAGGPVVWDDTLAYEGRYSVRIDSPTEELNTGWLTENRQPVEEGQTLVFRGWVRLQQAWGDNELTIIWYDNNGKWLKTSRSEKLNGTCEWQEIMLEAAVPPGARSARFSVGRRFQTEEDGGVSWFDDLSVSVKSEQVSFESEKSERMSPNWSIVLNPSREGRGPSPAGNGKNLLSNGKVTAGKEGSPEGWSRLENEWGKTEWEIVTDKVRGLSIADTLDSNVGWRSDPVAVSGGAQMILSLQLMMKHSSHVRMGLDWLDSNQDSLGVVLSSDLAGNEKWQAIWMEAQAPADACFVQALVTQDKSSGISLFTDFALTTQSP